MIRPALGLCLAAVAAVAPAADPANPTARGKGLPSDPVPTAKPGVPLEFVVVPDSAPARLEVRVEIDGQPLSAVWDDAFAKLAAYFDRDGNGSLDEKEAARLPDAVALRHVLGTGFTPPVGLPPAFAELDADKDGKVTPAEVAAFYRKAGLGSAVVGVGRLPNGPDLTNAILAAVDADKDGKVTETEWKTATAALAKLDGNDDELIGAGELLPKAIYPGATGSVLLSDKSREIAPADVRFAFPVALLPADAADRRWATDLVERRKPLGKPTADELLATRNSAPAATWVVRLGDKSPPTDRLAFVAGNVLIDGWAADGKLAAASAGVRKELVAALERGGDEPEPEPAGGNRRRRPGGIAWLTPTADRNGDGKLDRAELDAWLDLQDQITRGHVLVTLIDGGGLFELLDANHDGALSVREVRGAWDRLSAAGCVTGGRFDPKKLPRVVLATVSRGHPAATDTRRGPAWFKAMDRNGDGDVSRKEFTGDPDAFDKLDADKDGLLSPEEATKPKKQPG